MQMCASVQFNINSIMIILSSLILLAFLFLKKKHGERNWESMPPDLLEEVSDRLPVRDLVAFRGVCAAWRRAPSGRAELPRFPRTRQTPWLMFYCSDDVMSYLYCHSRLDCCRLRLPHLRGATVLQSRSGWLLARRGENFFLINPFTFATIHLPNHRTFADQAATMTTLPPAKQSKVFVVSRKDNLTLEISFCRVGDAEWKSHTVAVGAAQLGNILRVNACNCGDGGHDAESCGFKDADRIYIRGSKVTVAYDYTERTYVDEGENASGGGSNNLRCWYEGPESQPHRANWLRRFGAKGKGISISICYQSIRLAGRTVGFLPMTEVVPGDGAVTEFTTVKATWIEPIFS